VLQRDFRMVTVMRWLYRLSPNRIWPLNIAKGVQKQAMQVALLLPHVRQERVWGSSSSNSSSSTSCKWHRQVGQ